MRLTTEHRSTLICSFICAAWLSSEHSHGVRPARGAACRARTRFWSQACSISLSGVCEGQAGESERNTEYAKWKEERMRGMDMVCGRRGLWSRQKQTERGSLTKEGSSGSGVRGEPSGVEGQLWSLALVTSPSARASNEGNPSSSTGILSRVSVSTASKLASFSSSIFLESGKGKGWEKKNRGRK